ncbi:DUF4331 family protein [Streptomyces eurythermus]|uniref:DUF4331 family protein n=1 Tax=Streptomyces eurythermus TaxID=42237 RepID=UPI0036F99C66
MSHHLSGPGLRSPMDDARLDLTDLFAFTALGDRTVLIMNVNPVAPTGDQAFHPDAVHRIDADTDGDHRADVAFSRSSSGPAWSVRRDGRLKSVDRGAHPSLTAYFNADDVKDAYNVGEPADDRDTCRAPWAAVLQHFGGYDERSAEQALRTVLPDILRLDRGKPTAYPNGRTLTDDVTSARLATLTGGKVPPTTSVPTPICSPLSPASASPTPADAPGTGSALWCLRRTTRGCIRAKVSIPSDSRTSRPQRPPGGRPWPVRRVDGPARLPGQSGRQA